VWLKISVFVFLFAVIFFHGDIFKRSYPVHSDGAVLITGASTGIGRDLSNIFAKKGFKVFAGVRKQADADSVAKDHKNIIPVILDQTKESQINSARDTVSAHLRKEKLKFVGLINNAGVSIRSPIEFQPIDSVREMMDVNYFGVVAVTQAFMPFIRESKGRIINIGSLLGEISLPFSASYSASKFALRSFTDSLRRELIPWNIYVGIVEPSYVITKIGEKNNQRSISTFDKMPKEALKYYGEAFAPELLNKRKLNNEKNSIASLDCAQQIYDTFAQPRPNARYILGYGTTYVTLLSYLSDSVSDYFSEMLYWPLKKQ